MYMNSPVDMDVLVILAISFLRDAPEVPVLGMGSPGVC